MSVPINSIKQTTSRKITPLESMRGIAAFVVFLFHFLLGFAPQYHGQEAATAIPGGNLYETPFFFLINGHAAVTFFFVLSGFVLSYSYFSKGINDGLQISVIKRWPRLFPLALISTLISWMMIHYGLYSYTEAAQVTQSQWMSRFASSYGDFLGLSFTDAFRQGFFYTFFRGDYNLNTSLWTMHYELIGSLLVFGLIPLLNGAGRKQALILFVLLMLAAFYTSPYMCAFIMGCFLSYYRCQVRPSMPPFHANRVLLIIGLVVVILMFGYMDPARGFYSFMHSENRDLMKALRIVLHSLASVILIQMIMSYDGFYKLLDGRIGRLLGRCSFALYVIHVPLLFTFSTAVFLALLDVIGYQNSFIVTFVLTLPVLFLISWLLAKIDEFWCRKVNRTVKKMF